MTDCKNCTICYKKVTHCIFDLDGTLIDTEPLYTQAIQMILDPYGKTYDFETKLKCMGLSNDKMGEFIIEKFELPISPEEYIRQQEENTLNLMQNTKLLPGVERLLNHLSAHKVPMALATGSSRESYDIKAKPHLELFKVFNHIVLASSDPEVKQGKPAPDIFLVTAARFPDKPKPAKCLVFEDAPNGLEAGVRAGMQVVLVPDARLSSERSQTATQCLKTLEYFKPEDFGLPAFDKSDVPPV